MVEHVASTQPVSSLFALRGRDIWRFVKRQPLSYWLLCVYLFLEYVRPQTIYPAIDVVPWSLITLIACFVAVLVEGKGQRRWTIIDIGLTVYTLFVVVSSLTAYDPAYAFAYANLTMYYVWVLVYFLITASVTTEDRYFVFLMAFLAFNLKMSQHALRAWAALGFGFSQWAATGAPGWFQNPGELGVEMTIFLPISAMFYLALRPHVSMPKRWILLALPLTALGAIAATSSRGAQLGFVAVGMWYIIRSRYRGRGLIILAVAASALYFILPSQELDRFRSMGSDKTSETRLTMWKHGIEIAEDHPFLGIGYQNWLPYYRNRYDPDGQLPHNVFVQAGAEMGFGGLLAFLFLIGGTLVVNRRTRRLAKRLGSSGRFAFFMAHGLDGAMIGFLASGFFVTVLYYPFFWVNLAMTVALQVSTARKCQSTAPPVRSRRTTWSALAGV